eukprot:COSAG05_NODE_3080_length_2338_cov_69.757034_2_plen_88_part_00
MDDETRIVFVGAGTWPTKGEIVFKDVSMKYRPHLPLALDRVSVTIRGGDRVGICGRTGSVRAYTYSLCMSNNSSQYSGRMIPALISA